MGAEGTQRLPHTYPVLKHSQKGAQQPSSTGTAFPVPVRSDFCEEESIRSTRIVSATLRKQYSSSRAFELGLGPKQRSSWVQ